MKHIISFRFSKSIIERIKFVARRNGQSQTQVVESILDSNLPEISRVKPEVGDRK